MWRVLKMIFFIQIGKTGVLALFKWQMLARKNVVCYLISIVLSRPFPSHHTLLALSARSHHSPLALLACSVLPTHPWESLCRRQPWPVAFNWATYIPTQLVLPSSLYPLAQQQLTITALCVIVSSTVSIRTIRANAHSWATLLTFVKICKKYILLCILDSNGTTVCGPWSATENYYLELHLNPESKRNELKYSVKIAFMFLSRIVNW